MNLSRIGANRKEVRATAFEGRNADIAIDERTGQLHFSICSASGMGAQGQYDYKITLEPDDIALVLKALSNERSIFKAGPLQNMLASSTLFLVREGLHKACASVPAST